MFEKLLSQSRMQHVWIVVCAAAFAVLLMYAGLATPFAHGEDLSGKYFKLQCGTGSEYSYIGNSNGSVTTDLNNYDELNRPVELEDGESCTIMKSCTNGSPTTSTFTPDKPYATVRDKDCFGSSEFCSTSCTRGECRTSCTNVPNTPIDLKIDTLPQITSTVPGDSSVGDPTLEEGDSIEVSWQFAGVAFDDNTFLGYGEDNWFSQCWLQLREGSGGWNDVYVDGVQDVATLNGASNDNWSGTFTTGPLSYDPSDTRTWVRMRCKVIRKDEKLTGGDYKTYYNNTSSKKLFRVLDHIPTPPVVDVEACNLATDPDSCSAASAGWNASGAFQLYSDESLALRWNSSNASSCSTSNTLPDPSSFNESGTSTASTDYTVDVPASSSSATYQVQCTGPDGTSSDSVVVDTLPDKADLRPDSSVTAVNQLTYSGDLSDGGTVNFDVEVENNGLTASGPFTVKIEFTNNDPGVTLTGSSASLNPGETATIPITWNSAIGGDYTIRAFIDSGSAVDETNELNNYTTPESLAIDLADPTATLSVSINGGTYENVSTVEVAEGDTASLQWTSTNADTCQGSANPANSSFVTGGDTGPATDAVDIPAPQASVAYTVACSFGGGTPATDTVTIEHPLYDVTLQVSDENVRAGESVNFSWDIGDFDPQFCSFSGPVASQDPIGSAPTNVEINARSEFILSCNDRAGHDAEATITVNVIPSLFES